MSVPVFETANWPAPPSTSVLVQVHRLHHAFDQCDRRARDLAGAEIERHRHQRAGLHVEDVSGRDVARIGAVGDQHALAATIERSDHYRGRLPILIRLHHRQEQAFAVRKNVRKEKPFGLLLVAHDDVGHRAAGRGHARDAPAVVIRLDVDLAVSRPCRRFAAERGHFGDGHRRTT